MIVTTLIQKIARIALGLLLLCTGTGHLTWARTAFQAQVPAWVPLNADLVVLLSGAAELALGLSLVFWQKKQVPIGWLTALFFVLIFPGNISQYLTHTDAFGLDTDMKRLVRLFFQPVLVGWALWTTGAWQAWRASRHDKV